MKQNILLLQLLSLLLTHREETDDVDEPPGQTTEIHSDLDLTAVSNAPHSDMHKADTDVDILTGKPKRGQRKKKVTRSMPHMPVKQRMT